MKNKLVLWGSNAQDERVLVALELRPDDNKVDLFVFPESVATEEFSQQLMDSWRDDKEVEFPEPYEKMERELSITDSLLPENIRVERTDVVQRAQTEWHFVVLSSKLHQAYQSELDELTEGVNKLESFDDKVWENLKGFWDKVQTQIRDRNLLREHAGLLREGTNALFGQMKKLRSKLDEAYKQSSKKNVEHFMAMLEEVEGQIEEGKRLQDLFEDLKGIQRKFRDTDFTREHRSKVWQRLDSAFKTVKEKRFGKKGEDRSPFDRLKRRYEGLISAIGKMERSIQRDQNDLEFQGRKIARTDGQLEAQLRQAKIKMIEERIRSKEEKLGEMKSTQQELEKRLEVEKEKEAQRQEKKRLAEARKEAEAKIAQKIQEEAAARKEESDKLEKAARAIVGEAEGSETEKTDAEEKTAPPVVPAVPADLTEVVENVSAIADVVTRSITEAVAEVTPSETPPAPAPTETETKETSTSEEPVEEAVETPVGEDAADPADPKTED